MGREMIALDDPRLALEGLLELRREDGWWQAWRLPADRIATAHAPTLARNARMAAGARIGMRTDATAVGIAIAANPADEWMPTALLDIVVDGELLHRLPIAPGRVEAELPAGVKRVEIWLPQVGDVRFGDLELGGHTVIEPMPTAGPRWITYGSSITHCSAAAGPSETWPALVARRNGWHLRCLGFGGDCHLDPIVARTIRDAEADLISMCLGINIYGGSTYGPRTLASAISGFIEYVRDGHPETPIVVMTPIVSPEREDAPNLVGMTLAEVREVAATAVGTLARLGDERLALIDGREVLGADEAHLLWDGLHPSAEGYRWMADRLGPRLREALATHAEGIATVVGQD